MAAVKRMLLVFVLVIFTFFLKAQPLYFKHYQVENGLSNNTVFCSIQDNAGFMWFGTKEGLNRFDGYHFKLFALEAGTDALAPEPIYSLLADGNGTLWIGSQKGLYRFDARLEKMHRVADSLTDVTNLLAEANGDLWFTAAGSLCRYNQQTNTLKRFPRERYFNATSICKTADGQIWISSSDGYLKKFLSATQTFQSFNVFAHSAPATSNGIQKIYAVGADSIFIGTSSQGIKLFQTPMLDYTDLLSLNDNRTTIFVRDILQYAPGEFWFATESGLFILQKQTGQFTNIKKKALDPYSLSDNALYALCNDREGGVWAGTYFGGVNYFPRQYTAFQKYFPDYSKNSISGSVVREICEDHYGNLWIGTEDAGLNKLDKKTGRITRFEPAGTRGSIAYSNIHGLLADGDKLWIGTFEHGLDVMDVRTGQVLKHYMAGPDARALKSNFVVNLLKTRSGAIYAATSNGVFLYHAETDDFTPIILSPEGVFISTLYEDHTDHIWAGTHGQGVYAYNPATARHEHFKNIAGQQNSLSANVINAIYEDAQHALWFATEGGGLCKLNVARNTFTRYTTRNGLPGNFVFKVLEDANGLLWISTSKGLAQMNKTGTETTVYTKASGLLSDQFNYNSGYKDAAGRLYFGSVKGMVAFSPASFQPNTFQPPVYITGFQVHNTELAVDATHGILRKSLLYTNKVTLQYNQSSFSIDVAALGYTAPESTTYSYMMHGIDKEPVLMKSNHKIYFTNLAPGQYLFQVAALQNGKEPAKQKTLSITVLPPVWASKWAWVVYISLGILALYYSIRSYHMHVVNEKEKELYEAKLDFFTNITHEIRTPLTLIKGPVENLSELSDSLPQIQDDVRMLDRATNRLLALITQILDFRKAETKRFSLYFTNVNITKLLREEFEAFLPLAKKRKLSYALQLPASDVIAFADEEAIQKIISNLLSNAVKYAATNITVQLSQVQKRNGFFTIEFSNDGYPIPAEMQERIFEPFFRIKNNSKTPGTGIGLALAQSLAMLHNGTLQLKAAQTGFNIFVLQLPLKPQPDAKVSQPKSKIFS